MTSEAQPAPPPGSGASANGDDAFYRRAMRRIYIHVLWLGVAGTLAAALWLGLPWGLGFLIGAGASALNFRWLHQLTESIGPGAKKPGKGLSVFLSFRYLLFGGAGYVIVRYFEVDIMAALVGLFVAVAAVLLEILYELIYA